MSSERRDQEVAIQISGLSKCFHIYETPGDRLRQFLVPRVQRALGRPQRQYFREFWALKNVSLEVRRGETVALVGRNGSGKSTLLQIISGTLTQTGGKVMTRGRIAALLELGSGFNPEFSGRDNVYMNAALLGLSRQEVKERFESIAQFADIGDFMDQPVKTYSSGMVVRLAFAVQAQVDPDIIIVDEALAVGDAKFQAKCFQRLKELKDRGTSILLVTHSTEQVVMHCSRAVLLSDGEVVESGEPRHVVNRYMDMLFGAERTTQAAAEAIAPPAAAQPPRYALSSVADVFSTRSNYNPNEYRWGDGQATLLDFYLSADGEAYPAAVYPGQKLTIGVAVRFLADLDQPILGLTLKTKEGVTLYSTNTELQGCTAMSLSARAGEVRFAEAVFDCLLGHGDYFISLGIATRQGGAVTPHDRRYDSIHFHVAAGAKFTGLFDMALNFRAPCETP